MEARIAERSGADVLCLTVHDEVKVEVAPEGAEEAYRVLLDGMTFNLPGGLLLTGAATDVGQSWDKERALFFVIPELAWKEFLNSCPTSALFCGITYNFKWSAQQTPRPHEASATTDWNEMSHERYALTAKDRDIAFFAAVQRAVAGRVTNTSDSAQYQGGVDLASLKRQLAMIATGRPNTAARQHAPSLQVARLWLRRNASSWKSASSR